MHSAWSAQLPAGVPPAAGAEAGGAGGRMQAVAFVGRGVHRTALAAALDACLCQDHEVDPANWKLTPAGGADPFEAL